MTAPVRPRHRARLLVAFVGGLVTAMLGMWLGRGRAEEVADVRAEVLAAATPSPSGDASPSPIAPAVDRALSEPGERARLVRFRSRRVRRLQIGAGLVSAAIGALLIWPSLRPTPDAGETWGMWVGIDFPVGATERVATETYMRLTLRSEGCGEPTKLTGTLSPIAVQPRARPGVVALRIALAGVTAHGVRVSIPGQRRVVALRAVALHGTRWHGATVLARARLRWTGGAPIHITMSLDGANVDGAWGNCYAKTPQLFDQAAEVAQWKRAADAVEAVNEDDRLFALPTQGVVETRIDGYSPAGVAQNAGGLVVRDGLRLTCDAVGDDPAGADARSGAREDDIRSNCASVQQMRSATSTAKLNLMVFGAGLAFAAAVQLLLEAAFADVARSAVRMTPA